MHSESQLGELGVIFRTSTVVDGDMSTHTVSESEAAENRERFITRVGLIEREVSLMQVDHTDVVMKASCPLMHAEALHATDDRALALLTADCLPVAFFDPHAEAFLLAHLGWKPITRGLVAKAVGEMTSHYGTDPRGLCIAIGPSIQSASYVFPNALQECDLSWRSFLHRDESGVHIDLRGRVVYELTSCGVLRENITSDMADTGKSEEYFSHYRGTKEGRPMGRMITVLARV